MQRRELLRLRGSLDFARDDGAFLPYFPQRLCFLTVLILPYFSKKTLLFLVLVYPCSLQRPHFLTTLDLSLFYPRTCLNLALYSLFLSLTLLFLFSFFLFIVVIICYICKFLLLLILFYLNFLPLARRTLDYTQFFLFYPKPFLSLYTFIFFTHPKGFTLLLNLLYTISLLRFFFLTTLVLPYFPNKKKRALCSLFFMLIFCLILQALQGIH